MPKVRSTALSLFDGVESAVNDLLAPCYRLKHHHKGLSIEFRRVPPTADLGAALTQAVHQQVVANFRQILSAVDRKARPISPENWRMVPRIKRPGSRPEVSLERALVKAIGKARLWNQVPVASGLVNHTAYKTCAIDLVYKRGNRTFDFIELKIASNTPLYAAVEILQYGFVWLLSRKHRLGLGYGTGTLLDADKVTLCVFAPIKYYRQVDFGAFQQGVTDALREIAQPYGPAVSFRLQQFPSDFVWPGSPIDELASTLAVVGS